jgi:hypothetical protein
MKPIEKQRTRLKSICFVAFFWITLQDNIVAEGERKRNRPGSAHLLACASGSRAATVPVVPEGFLTLFRVVLGHCFNFQID